MAKCTPLNFVFIESGGEMAGFAAFKRIPQQVLNAKEMARQGTPVMRGHAHTQ
jgi:hypothetical protein